MAATKPKITFQFTDGTPIDVGMKRLGEILQGSAAGGINIILTRIGILISNKYSLHTSTLTAAIKANIDPNLWTWRSGRLGRSYLDGITFDAIQIPITKKARMALNRGVSANSLAKKVTGKGALSGKGTKEGIHFVESSKTLTVGYKGSKVPYAGRLEFQPPWKRPALVPAANEAVKDLAKVVVDVWESGAKADGWR